MYAHHGKLADLHTHLYGCIDSADFLAFLLDREVNWTAYKDNFQKVYGYCPPIAEILERCRESVVDGRAEFNRLFVFGDDDAGNFDRFQAKYDILLHGSASAAFSRKEAPLSALINDVCLFIHKTIARQRRQNVGYIEQRITLGRRYTQAQAKELLRAMLSAYAEYKDSDIQPRLAISLPRENPWPAWEVVQEMALTPSGRFLTGIDFCFFEEGHPPKEQRELFDSVKDFNERHPERALAILYHVGESFNDKSLESAVRWVHETAELGAHRLGHAIALGVNPDQYGNHSRPESVEERIDQLGYDLRHQDGLAKHGVHVNAAGIAEELERIGVLPANHRLTIEYDDRKLDELRQRQRYAIGCIRELGAVIEVCPTSNWRIGGISNPEHHPVKQFLSNNAPFVVATDDPGIFGTTLADEIEWVRKHCRLPHDVMEHIVHLSWSSRSEVLTGRLSKEYSC